MNKKIETVVDDMKLIERENIVKWMKEVIAEKPAVSERKAFMAKLSSVCNYHGINLEELSEKDL